MLFLLFAAVSFPAHAAHADKPIVSISDLNGKRLAILVGTNLDIAIESQLDYAQILYFDTFAMMEQALLGDDVDAIIGDYPVMCQVAAKRADLRALEEELKTGDAYGFAVRLDDDALFERIGAAIQKLKDDGALARLDRKWLNGTPEDKLLPPGLDDVDGKVLRMGTCPALPPFTYVDEHKKVVGHDIEMAYRAAGLMARKLVVMEFGELVPALLTGKVDFIGGGITVTPERSSIIRFTESYYQVGLGALVKEKP